MVADSISDHLRKRMADKRRLSGGPLFYAIVAQALLLLLTAFIITSLPYEKQEPDFSAKKKIYLPQRELEHRMAVSEFQQAAKPPKLTERLTTSALLPDSIPAMPALPTMDFNPVMTEVSPLSDAQALLGQSGLLSAAQGLKTSASKVSLFGIDDTAERVVIMFDDGGSVLNKAKASGVPLETIKEQTIELIDSLNANTLFGIVNFVRRIGHFKPFLVPATKDNKALAKQWIEDRFSNSYKTATLDFTTSGIQGAFEVAFQLDPDVIFLMSDADFQSNESTNPQSQVGWDDLSDTLEDLQEDRPEKARIHFIGFQVESDHEREMKRIVRRYGGKYNDM